MSLFLNKVAPLGFWLTSTSEMSSAKLLFCFFLKFTPLNLIHSVKLKWHVLLVCVKTFSLAQPKKCDALSLARKIKTQFSGWMFGLNSNMQSYQTGKKIAFSRPVIILVFHKKKILRLENTSIHKFIVFFLIALSIWSSESSEDAAIMNYLPHRSLAKTFFFSFLLLSLQIWGLGGLNRNVVELMHLPKKLSSDYIHL